MSEVIKKFPAAIADEARVEVEVTAPGVDIAIKCAVILPLQKLLVVSFVDQGGQHLISSFPIENPDHTAYVLHWHAEVGPGGHYLPIYVTEDHDA